MFQNVAYRPNVYTIRTGVLTVIFLTDLPDDGPEIGGGQPRYNIGDKVNVTCISRNSLPAAKLSWYINGEKADPIYLRTYPEQKHARTGLQTSTLGLTFLVRFYNDLIKYCDSLINEQTTMNELAGKIFFVY